MPQYAAIPTMEHDCTGVTFQQNKLQNKDQECQCSMKENVAQKTILTTPNDTSWCNGSWAKN